MAKKLNFLTKADLKAIEKLIREGMQRGVTEEILLKLTEIQLEIRENLKYIARVNAGVIMNGRKLDLILKNRLSYEELQEIAKMEVEFKESMEKLKN